MEAEERSSSLQSVNTTFVISVSSVVSILPDTKPWTGAADSARFGITVADAG